MQSIISCYSNLNCNTYIALQGLNLSMTLCLTFIYSFSQFLLSANYNVPDTMVGSGDTTMTKGTRGVLFSWNSQSSKRNRQKASKQINTFLQTAQVTRRNQQGAPMETNGGTVEIGLSQEEASRMRQT